MKVKEDEGIDETGPPREVHLTYHNTSTVLNSNLRFADSYRCWKNLKYFF